MPLCQLSIDEHLIAVVPDFWQESPHWLQAVFEHEKPTHNEACIRLVDKATIQQLNRDFLGKDKATNVLSFPNGEDGYAGDIAICPEIVRQEATEFDLAYLHRAAHMVIHAALHLLGYTHDLEQDQKSMEAKESLLMQELNFPDPWQLERN